MESNIKGLVAAGHEMASELKAECGAVDMCSVAKLISDLATQLEVQLVRANALAAENAKLKKFCKDAAFDADYEAELGMERGGFSDAAVQKVLDNLSQQKLVHRDVLPFSLPVTPDGWISCSEQMPDDGQHVIILCDGAFVLYAQYRDGEFFDVVRNGEEFFETQSRNVTDWMPLPEPPQEAK
ncbi:DUF551 domain-containing protein [Escherichia coli]|nr:DUF551 domain-containing protein [Escherichia coli]